MIVRFRRPHAPKADQPLSAKSRRSVTGPEAFLLVLQPAP